MSRKIVKSSVSQTTAKKNTDVPPKAVAKVAEIAKPVTAPATPVTVTAEKATPAVTKVEIAPVVTAKAEAAHACGAATAATPAASEDTGCCHAKSTVSATTLEALHGSDADLARDAATALGLLADRSAVEPLVAVLNNANGYFHSVVRAAAAQSLGALGDGRALEPLLNAITDPIAEVSSESIRALATLGDPQAVDALIDVVRNRHGFFLNIARRAAVLALAKIGGDRAVKELRLVAADGYEDPTIRETAESAISQNVTA